MTLWYGRDFNYPRRGMAQVNSAFFVTLNGPLTRFLPPYHGGLKCGCKLALRSRFGALRTGGMHLAGLIALVAVSPMLGIHAVMLLMIFLLVVGGWFLRGTINKIMYNVEVVE